LYLIRGKRLITAKKKILTIPDPHLYYLFPATTMKTIFVSNCLFWDFSSSFNHESLYRILSHGAPPLDGKVAPGRTQIFK
jgi:hypothetical protein